MTIQDEYLTSVRQAQQTWTGVADSFAESLQKIFTQSGQTFPVLDPSAAIDQVFDFWGKTLEVQRDVAKQLVGATVAVGDQVRTQAESVGTTLREQVASVQAATREHASKKYDDLTKAELQDELAGRDLPKTGNVDELRERLIADDQK